MMKSNIEKEAKCLLTPNEYQKLKASLPFVESQLQNYYYLSDNGYGLRFRYIEENGSYLFTLKQKLEDSHREYEIETKEINFDNNEIKELFSHLNIKEVKYLGKLNCLRLAYKGERGEFCLDYCQGNNIEEYEFEYELFNPEDDFEEAFAFLRKHNISYQKSAKGKFHRFLENYQPKVMIMCATGLEECEALMCYDLLYRAGIGVDLINTNNENEITSSHNLTFKTNIKLEDINSDDYVALVLPGGIPGTPNLRNNEAVINLIKKFYQEKRLLAAICAAPSILLELGYLKDNEFSIYPGFEGDKKANETSLTKKGNIITGNGLGASQFFGYEIIKHLLNEEKATEVLTKIQSPFLKV